MRKSQPITRSSFEEDPKYRQGYEAGFQAGQRANREAGVQQQINRFNGQPFSSTIGNQRTQSQDNKTNKNFGTNIESSTTKGTRTIKTGRLSNEYLSRRSFGNATSTRDNNHLSNHEHEIPGQTTNPETEVKFNTRGHY